MIARATAVAFGIASTLATRVALAQSPPAAPLTLAVGDFLVTPSLDVRTRGEYRRDAVDLGGLDGADNATPRVRDAVGVVSRARVGLGAERGPLRAQITLQDARAWGATPPSGALSRSASSTAFGAFEAYAEARVPPRPGVSAPVRETFLRIGRQAVHWGDGMLVGAADWAPGGRSLDAVRAELVLANWEFELLAALLEAPRPLGASMSDAEGPFRGGTELFGARAAWAIAPLAKVEGAALARISNRAGGADLSSRFAAAQAVGETYTASLRVSGERGPFAYAAEGAAQAGRSPALSPGFADRLAFAGTCYASFRLDDVVLTPTARVGGAFATGEGKGASYAQFDPILPDVHTALGSMDAFALSNLMEVNGRLTIAPADELRASVEYRYARLAASDGEWLNGYLVSVGRPAAGADAELGHEVDAVGTWQLWSALSLNAGYSILFLGDGARSVLATRQRGRLEADGTFTPASLAHFAYVQATLRAP